MKTCTKCATTKDETEFHMSRGTRRRDCKACVIARNQRYIEANREAVRARAREWYAANPEKAREKQLKVRERRYGIDRTTYFAMIEEQSNQCKLCSKQGTETKPLVIDHCHRTGKVRGLLCNECNQALGLLKDQIETLKNAIEYLS